MGQKGKKIELSLMDAAILVNLIRAVSTHPDHNRIADDIQKQMLEGGNESR